MASVNRPAAKSSSPSRASVAASPLSQILGPVRCRAGVGTGVGVGTARVANSGGATKVVVGNSSGAGIMGNSTFGGRVRGGAKVGLATVGGRTGGGAKVGQATVGARVGRGWNVGIGLGKRIGAGVGPMAGVGTAANLDGVAGVAVTRMGSWVGTGDGASDAGAAWQAPKVKNKIVVHARKRTSASCIRNTPLR